MAIGASAASLAHRKSSSSGSRTVQELKTQRPPIPSRQFRFNYLSGSPADAVETITAAFAVSRTPQAHALLAWPQRDRTSTRRAVLPSGRRWVPVEGSRHAVDEHRRQQKDGRALGG